MKGIFLSYLLFFSFGAFSQNYTSYFTGNTTNITTIPQGGVCLMGGATENDEAMKWFLQRCNGGDVLVLRTSGANGYNNYMYSTLGIPVNSVETIVCNNAAASNDSYVQQKIQQAEAIWFAGGDQSVYTNYWRNTPVATLINDAIANRNIVIGGTSAGMAIMGRYYFNAQNGTVTSATALNNPYTSAVTPDSISFIKANYLDSIITDTHYDNPDRRGRHVTFLARLKKDRNLNLKGIACDEYTAVCINNSGLAKVYGGYPTFDDNAYFIQANCEQALTGPEICINATPLTWDRGNEALKVFNVKGTFSGSNTFDLTDWKTGAGGNWQRWYVINGVLQTAPASPVNCAIVPLTIISFTARKNMQEVFLNWETVNEINSGYFNVQKSSDGFLFETIGKVNASFSSNQIRAYHYKDSRTFTGTAYYRLQVVDTDGKFQYSKTLSVNFDKGSSFLIYPNPSYDNSVFIKTAGRQMKKVIVLNETGQKISEQSFDINLGQQTLHMSGFSKGLYFLELYTKENEIFETRKLIIK